MIPHLLLGKHGCLFIRVQDEINRCECPAFVRMDKELAMPDLLVFLWVSISIGLVLVDAWSGSKQRASALPSLSEVVIT